MLLRGWDTEEVGTEIFNSPAREMWCWYMPDRAPQKVIVWLNCVQRIVTAVGSELRVLPVRRLGRALPSMPQRFHSCHRLIVPPITHNYSWQQQRHSEMIPACLIVGGWGCYSLVWDVTERRNMQMICFKGQRSGKPSRNFKTDMTMLSLLHLRCLWEKKGYILHSYISSIKSGLWQEQWT